MLEYRLEQCTCEMDGGIGWELLVLHLKVNLYKVIHRSFLFLRIFYFCFCMKCGNSVDS